MSKLIMAMALLFTALMMQGCEKNMEYEPRDFFVGRQLDIAQLIYDGDEVKLNEKLPSISKEELNRPVKADMTLLFWSVLNAIYDKNTPKRLSIITDLVKAGADPLQPRPEGGSSPAEFVLQGDKDVWIKAMLDGGLPPNSRDKVHNEPIIFEALDAKNTETLKVMLDYGADINTRDSLGNTLLISSLDSRSFDHTILLLERGADSKIKGKFGWTMGNQLQRFIDRGVGDAEDKEKIDKIKELLIKKGGDWPPLPVEN
ncbi:MULTISPECIES: ankyrin repeat domain-containing protein [Serratia]|uniref:ankyrin repeat domain-containing protein n=1 Tax=Serratia TaxID=613 RepID=UPI0004E3F92D|nr:ankyrin repeat domain-containing protein [Serratia marcescens]KFB54316.1 Inversin [Serratia marcescens]MBN5334663.1 ankyrin repeat domain-containing protein [Serratia marcescens]MBN5338196.1 ankyrin repeat domain-containing protein [Serratia marcescens]MCW7558635.1 ankyrin repeat domain-containing protein [Serratia marcescens]MCW7563539.1 ankyrin repeat domain-containing protein [Serratia marcescens]